MKRKLIITCLLLTLLLTACGKQSSPQPSQQTPDTIDTISLNGKLITLQPKDEVSMNAWNEFEATYNEESYDSSPVLNKGITLGSSIEEVLKAFDIKEGNAMVSREVGNGDGTTDIIEEEYKNVDFFKKEDVLDANFLFAYTLHNKKWKPVSYQELNTILQDRDNAKNVLLYQIDICGSAFTDEAAKEGQVIMFDICYLG